MFWKKKRPPFIKHSISRKMNILYSVVLLGAFAACWLANNFFLERYYVSNKEEVLREAYKSLDDASGTETLEEDEFVQQLGVLCETNNIPRRRFSWRRRCPRGDGFQRFLLPLPESRPVPWTRPQSVRLAAPDRGGWRFASGFPRG